MAFSGRKKRPARVLFAAILLIVVYFFLFPYPLGRELVARPRWAVAIPATAASGAPGQAPGAEAQPPDGSVSAAAFQLGDRFGFVREDGTVLYTGRVAYQVALSSTGFVSFTRLGTDWILQDLTGRRVAGFSVAGYPLLSPDGSRVFCVKTDLSGIIEMDLGGGALWDRDFPTLMTSISVQGGLVLAGLLNGSVVLLDRRGSTILEHAPGGSRVAVIAGVSAAPDGSRIAAVSGIDPQYLVVLRRAGSGYDPEAREVLASAFRREVRMGFSPDSRFLFIEGPSGPVLFDPARRAIRRVALPGPLAAAGFALGGRVAAFASRGAGSFTIALEPLEGIAVGREELPARDIFLGAIGGQLLLGWDRELARVDAEAM